MASKKRPVWTGLPAPVQAQVEHLVHHQVIATENCPGGYSPGFASRLRVAGGGSVFVKAIEADVWPLEAAFHRAEARVAGALPWAASAPRFLGSIDDGSWVILAFEYIAGIEPVQPWDLADLRRVAAAIDELSAAPATPAQAALPHDHPRLGGWAELSRDAQRARRLAPHSAWAAAHLPQLLALEQDGLIAAQGPSLVHFDLYSHNILLTPDRVVFVDWPHARLGAPFVDLVITLSSATSPRVDAEHIMREHETRRGFDREAVTAVLAAHAGFCTAGGLDRAPPGLEPIVAAKKRLSRGALTWLQRRFVSKA